MTQRINPIGNEWNPPAAAFGPSPAPSPPAPVIGWAEPYSDQAGAYAHANTGTYSYFNDFFGFQPMYAGIVGYAAGAVVWSSTWAPSAADPAPVLFAVSGRPDLIRVEWPLINPSTQVYSSGMLVLTASVNGAPVPVGERLVATASGSAYSDHAWGPEP